ncbi:MAG: CPBP family intramembrane metalloprotease [Lachnospiraceae bacterium]|nr:CPBP family intramembrane metalloprotease [Lachnospiraceae bacterium]MDD6448659.1 CPBP family intramembrane metalloprotease [Lachnospiraceae bacterium]MDD6450983.1 CPBP family intramembrane metalloprotease [Lachnospiraceae bacterium]MDD6578572.1 CPBP family intramembrane metalloprotease [Lachnospiraceae bacterium]
MKYKVSDYLKILFPIVAIELVTSIVTMIGGVFYALFLYASRTFDSLDDLLNTIKKGLTDTDFLMAASSVYALICICLFLFFFRKHSTKEERSLRGLSPLFLIGVVLIALSCQYLANYIVAIDAVAFPSTVSDYNKLMEASGLDSFRLLTIVYAACLGPICEELAFRGLTLHYGRKVFPFWAANLIQALLFGLVHMNFVQFSYAFALGLILGWLYLKTDTILVPILTHMTFNAISAFCSEYLKMPNNAYGFCIVLFLSLTACYLGMKWIENCGKKRIEKDGKAGGR